MKHKITKLCKLGYKYGTDKCPQIKHHYTPFYYEYFKDKRGSFKKVLEIGIGRTRRNRHIPEIIFELGIKENLERGASLYMWRDFFPNAKIYAADNNSQTIFEDERIQTFLCDERSEKDLIGLIKKTGSDIDLVIDDASHRVDDQIFAAKTLLPLLSMHTIYIIEDVSSSRSIKGAMSKQGNYNYTIPTIYRRWKGGMILIITKT